MGVNANAYLHHSADPGDVAMALAAITGSPCTKQYFRDSTGGWSARNAVARVTGHAEPYLVSMLNLEFYSAADQTQRFCGFHWRADNDRYDRCLVMAKSTSFWIAALTRLVETFGGELDYNDCDESPVDFCRPEVRVMAAGDGDAWYERQQRLLDIKPITEVDLALALPHSAYGV